LESDTLSNEGFFKTGVTVACLKTEGKLPEDVDRLTILVMTGAKM